MASSSSSTQKQHHHLLNLNHLYEKGPTPTSAPPPTPSSQPPLSSSSATASAAAADTLSYLLHRLPPNLSLPTRVSPRATATTTATSSPLPTHSLSSTSSSNFYELGYFQLTHDHHPIATQLAESAESDSVSLLESNSKFTSFNDEKEWPIGFNYDDENDHKTTSFCLDSHCLTTTELGLASLRELTRELEKVALEVVENVACAVGFENQLKEPGPGLGLKHSSLMWVSSSSSSSTEGDKIMTVYPYVVGVQYQIRPRKWDLVSDSGLVSVEPEVGSVLVTLGDIAQVWSNGKLKKVRGRPAPVSDKDGKSSLSMTLLLTLPLESTVSPLLKCPNNRENESYDESIKSKAEEDNDDDHHQSIDELTTSNDDDHEDSRVFNSFSFEDYAWRVYHERLLLKDPLDRYRVID